VGIFFCFLSQKTIENSHVPKQELYAYAANEFTLGADSSPVAFVLRDARGTGARGVMGSEKAREEEVFSPFPFPSPLAITPCAPVPRASRNMKTTEDESALGVELFCLLFYVLHSPVLRRNRFFVCIVFASNFCILSCMCFSFLSVESLNIAILRYTLLPFR